MMGPREIPASLPQSTQSHPNTPTVPQDGPGSPQEVVFRGERLAGSA